MFGVHLVKLGSLVWTLKVHWFGHGHTDVIIYAVNLNWFLSVRPQTEDPIYSLVSIKSSSSMSRPLSPSFFLVESPPNSLWTVFLPIYNQEILLSTFMVRIQLKMGHNNGLQCLL